MNTQAFNKTVVTRQGELRGSMADGVWSFKGVPFAAPPFGVARLKPPQPVPPWSGVRDALHFGPKPLQVALPPGFDVFMPEYVSAGEDCLTLNIWTPDLGAAGLPVMVWIPGGMFKFHSTGACPWYDGSRFARHGIVFVSINYRVGADGFLYLGKGNTNRGLLDQVAALEWVRDNIAAFGGNPGQVTIFGQSAGAISIDMLLTMPKAQGLFRRAIVQSGSAQMVISEASSQRVAQLYAEKLKVAATREAIAAVPLHRMLAAQNELEYELNTNPDPERWGSDTVKSLMLWQPVVDGDSIPAPPLERIAEGAGTDVDFLMGTARDENRLFMAIDGTIDRATTETLARAMEGYGLPLEKALLAYRAAYPDASAGDLFAALRTDWYWRIPTLRVAETRAQNNAVTYMYEFAWPSPVFNGKLGAYHGLDVAFVFDILGKSTEPLLGTDPPQALADTMHTAWVRFALKGDPGWPKYDIVRRAVMRFNTVSEVVEDPWSWERQLWEGVR